ncbi:putative transcriptional regulatory protein [Bradyrhizobium oligotrophicum S58]|uniref:Putative transcriptional regulatory protein n=1 Tax=Bradyrhizobium oligotrophicum S58 TaxID=1245469 RepID=M4ZVI2_9BRAD|nr:response regulator transcription factor [Bradyrhizobium oligotrophicum]BAM90350.1 putative transcriptional regulatory protein [Bradyrhizobium oligotrophicum S58]
MMHRAVLADSDEVAEESCSVANSAKNQDKGFAVATGWTTESGVDHPAAGCDQISAPASAASDAGRSMSTPTRPRILMVGDRGFTSLLKYILESNGFDCMLTDTLTDAIASATAVRPGLIALDDVSCGDRVACALEQLHRDPATQFVPTLIMASVSPHLEETCVHTDRTSYILKPFLPDIFIDRLHGILRESACSSLKVLRFADIVMESDAHRVSRGARSVRLCPVEYRILQHLLECPRKVFSREQILCSIRAHTQENAVRSIDVHISRIRKALCERGEPNYIRTVRGLGYSLDFAPDGPATYVPRPDLVNDARKQHRSDR